MTKIAVWCRHQNDNVIGIGPNIPWHIPSDFKRFRRLTEGKTLIAGQTTYESFPNRTLPNRKIIVLTFNADYELSDKQNHAVVTDIKAFKEAEGDFYISGGASVYKAFMTGGEGLMPDVIVDSMYCGELNPELTGKKVDIFPCIDIMMKDYRQISQNYERDNVMTTVWIRKNTFVDQAVLKHILLAIEAED